MLVVQSSLLPFINISYRHLSNWLVEAKPLEVGYVAMAGHAALSRSLEEWNESRSGIGSCPDQVRVVTNDSEM